MSDANSELESLRAALVKTQVLLDDALKLKKANLAWAHDEIEKLRQQIAALRNRFSVGDRAIRNGQEVIIDQVGESSIGQYVVAHYVDDQMQCLSSQLTPIDEAAK